MRNGGFWKVVADLVANLTLVAVLAVDGLVVYAIFVEGLDEHPATRTLGITMLLGYAFIVQLGLCIFGCGLQYVRSSIGARLATHILWAHFAFLATVAVGVLAVACIYSVIESF